MPAKQKYEGPYKVIKQDGMYEVVEMIDADVYEELRPRKRYTVQQSAYALCARLNKKHSSKGK